MIKKLPLFVWICNLTRSVQLQQAGNALADGLQAEVLCLDLFPRQPQHFARIVHRRCTLRIGNSAEEEHVDGMDVKPAVRIDIGDGEEEPRAFDRQASLFLHFPHNSLFACLVAVAEAAGEVERSLRRFLCPPYYQQLVLLVHDDRDCRGAWVEIIDEAASLATLALEVVLNESAGAAKGAISELCQWMLCHNSMMFCHILFANLQKKHKNKAYLRNFVQS